MKRAILIVLALSACVTTKQVDDDRSPDPRDDLPELTPSDQQTLAVAKREKLAATSPLTTVLEVAPLDPVINVRVVFRAGSSDDPKGKDGLAALTAKVMREATQKLTASQLADTLFPWAGELDVQVDKDTLVFIGRVHQDNAAAYADVLLDVIMRPRLDAGDFARVKSEHKAFLASTLRTGNDEALQREALEGMLYPDAHPYHHTPIGTVKGLDAITIDDVRGFIQSRLTRDVCVLGVSGGAPTSFVDKLKSGLEALPFSSGERAPVMTPALPEQNRAIFVDKPAAGSAISLGFVVPELSRTSPDYPAMKLAETWFGEHRNLIGHLFNSMRESRGLNYGDYAYVEHFRQEGWSSYEQLNIPRRTQYFSIWIRPVEHKNRLFALRQAAWELDKLVKTGIPDDATFEGVKAFVQGYWRAKEQEPMRRLGYMMDRVITKLPYDRDELRARVAKLTRAEVNDAIKRHLHSDRLSIVVVTENAKALADEIAKKTPSPITYAGKKPKAQLDEDKVIEVFDLGLAPDRVTVVPPSALFEE